MYDNKNELFYTVTKQRAGRHVVSWHFNIFPKHNEENWLQNILSKLLFQGVWDALGYKGMG